MKKGLLYVLLIGFVGIQFFQPSRNDGSFISKSNISKTYNIPDSVLSIFKFACFDCHTNHAVYPWYSYIQPVGWIIQNDILEGRANLNFDELGSYSSRRQISKWRDIENRISDGTMPLKAYKLLHKQARLSLNEKKLLVTWIQLRIATP